MPELPAVEFSKSLLEKHCQGKKILQAKVTDDPILFKGCSATEFREAIVGKRIQQVGRYGKWLYLLLDKEPHVMIHFGMTGFVKVKGHDIIPYKSGMNAERVLKESDDEWPLSHWKSWWQLEDEVEVIHCDQRRLGRVSLVYGHPLDSPEIFKLGFDPLLSMPKYADFQSNILLYRKAIKALLLDQTFVAGVGNWIADEVLYQAHIHPEQCSLCLTQEELKRLYNAIQKVVKKAVDANANWKEFPKRWLFHQRWSKGKKEIPQVGKHPVAFIIVGGRSSAYVPELQVFKTCKHKKRSSPLVKNRS